MRKKLSFIVPMYNMEQYIARCLDSLIHQDIAPEQYEIIVVDDGSVDNSATIVKSYQKEYSQITYLFQKNKGQAAARNTAISVAQGEYICFVDTDDFVRQNIFGQMVEVAMENGLDILAYESVSGSESIYPSIDQKEDSFVVSHYYKGDDYIATYNYSNYCWLYLINFDFYKKSNLSFKEGIYLEDIVFVTQLLLSAKKIAKIQVKAYYYFIRNNSTMHNKDKSHMLRLLNDYYQVILLLSDVLNEKAGIINNRSWRRIEEHRRCLIFFMLAKMLREHIEKPVIKKYVALLEAQKLYPFTLLPVNEYTGWKYKLIHKILTNKRLLLWAASIYR